MLKASLPVHKKRVHGLVDRARKRLHRRSYWQKLTETFPINGSTATQVAEELDRTLALRWQGATRVLLPGLTVRGGRAYYHHHELGKISSEIADLVAAHGNDIRGADAQSPTFDALFAEGLVFETREPSQAKSFALVISAHQDDAALSIGGLMASRAQLEQHLVLNVFTVSAWLGNGFHTAPLVEVSALRNLEENLSNQVLGSRSLGLGMWEAEVRHYHRRAVDNYPLRDGFVFARDPELRTLGERDSIQRGILQVVDKLRPTRIYFPLGLGSHVDHVYLRDAGLALAPALASSACEVFFFEDLPYATYDEVNAVVEVELLQTKQRRLDAHYVDISENIEQKVQAVAAHRSQFHRAENEERLRSYAGRIAGRTGMAKALAERIWRFQTL